MQDGTVRIWDPRTSARHSCIKVLDPSRGVEVPDTPAEVLKCVRGHHVPCLRFDASGSWLVLGSGGSNLGMWSMTLGGLARRVPTAAVPQVGLWAMRCDAMG